MPQACWLGTAVCQSGLQAQGRSLGPGHVGDNNGNASQGERDVTATKTLFTAGCAIGPIGVAAAIR